LLALPKTYYTVEEIRNLKNLQNEKYKLWIWRAVSNQQENKLLGYIFANYIFANILPKNAGCSLLEKEPKV